MSCPECQSPQSVKNGLMRGLQRYKCKDCGCNYTRSHAHYQAKDRKRRLALTLYMAGLSFHTIARLLGVSHVSVINWVKRYGRHMDEIRSPRPCRSMSPEELAVHLGCERSAASLGLTLVETADRTLVWLWGAETASDENTEQTGDGQFAEN